jgi:quinol monooxygenase YgiN
MGAVLFSVISPGSSTIISDKQKPKKMNKNILKVVAVAETSADKANDLQKVCLALIEPTRKEPGCISYELYQDVTDPGRFTFIEGWKSQEHLDLHLKTPHFVAAGEAFGKIVTQEMFVLKLNQLA